MTKEEIIAFVDKNPVFALATVDGNTPHVRDMMVCKADDEGIVFCTGKVKDVHKQITANPAVEMCFYSPDDQVQVRIAGSVELTEDLDLKKEIVEKFEFLKPWIESAGYEAMAVYRVKGGKACVWTMEKHDAPKEYIDL